MNVTFIKSEKVSGRKFQVGEQAHVPDDMAKVLVERGIVMQTEGAALVHTHLVNMFQAAHGRPVLLKRDE